MVRICICKTLRNLLVKRILLESDEKGSADGLEEAGAMWSCS